MLSKRAKGRKYEREYVKILEGRGFRCILGVPSMYHDNDFFNLFDTIAFSPNGNIFAQVKANQVRDAVKELKEFKKWLQPNDKIILAIRYDENSPSKRKSGWEEREI